MMQKNDQHIVAHNFSFAAEAPESLLKGFQEVVFCVRNIDQAIAFYESWTGWKLLYRGPGRNDQLAFWQVESHALLEEAVLGNPR